MKVATVIAVYANWGFARIQGIGWGWAGIIWIFSIITYIPLDILKFITRYALTGKAWDNLLENKVFNSTKSDLLFHFTNVFLIALPLCLFKNQSRLLSLPRRIMERVKGRLNGLQLSARFMVSSPQKP
jgi:hypothetical protein